MKWRKMADHVQVSGGFMFLHQTVYPHNWKWVRSQIRVLCSRYRACVWPLHAGGGCVWLVGGKSKDVAGCVDLWPAVIARDGLLELAYVSCQNVFSIENENKSHWASGVSPILPQLFCQFYAQQHPKSACLICVYQWSKQQNKWVAPDE